MRYSIIIPAFNEAQTIDSVLTKIFENKSKVNFEVIVVNDASDDNTSELLNKWANKIAIINKPRNEGKTKAIKSGVKITSGDYIAIQDADIEYDPNELFNIFDLINNNDYPVVYGSRLLKKNKYFSFFYYYGSRVITTYYNLLFGDKLTDLSTAYKVFRKDLIDFDKVTASRFGFCAQVTCMFKKKHVQIIEVPISYNPRSFDNGKKIRLWDGIQFIGIITKSFLVS